MDGPKFKSYMDSNLWWPVGCPPWEFWQWPTFFFGPSRIQAHGAFHRDLVPVKQSYEIKLPFQAFLDGRYSPWRKSRLVGCYDVANYRLVTIDSFAISDSFLLFMNLNHNTQPVLIFKRENLQNFKSQNGGNLIDLPSKKTW